jgi:uncharacterized membrane protein YhaH (DUF805 family)
LPESRFRRRLGTFFDFMFGHDGRIGRMYYWLGLLAMTGIIGLLAAIADELVPGTGDIGRYVAFGIIVGALIWMHSALTIKRLHDRDRAGIWYFLYGLAPPGLLLWAVYLHADKQYDAASLMYVISLLGFAGAFIELGLMRGTAGPNRFGPEN